MIGHPLFTPVLGDLESLGQFLSEFLPSQAIAKIPDLPPAPEPGPEVFWDSDLFDFEPPPVAGDPDRVPAAPEPGHADFSDSNPFDITPPPGAGDPDRAPAAFGIELIDLVLPTVAFGASGIFLDNDTFSFARPGSDTDVGNSKGGGGGKPSNDGGSGGDTGNLLTSYTSGGNAKTSYNIDINFIDGGWSVELQQVFIDAAEYLSSIILGDVSDERVPLFGRVDDLAIDASIVAIDDAGGVLGGAAVFASRVGSDLPAASIMQFDEADVGAALTDGYLSHIVVHEMVHAMGFGGKWADMGLTKTFTEEDANGVDQQVLRFIGANATAEYNKMAIAENDPYSMNGVLIEMDGGDGTAGAHWDDLTFTDLLMTGFIDTNAPGSSTLSTMSIAALEDMGYDTIYEPSVDGLFA